MPVALAVWYLAGEPRGAPTLSLETVAIPVIGKEKLCVVCLRVLTGYEALFLFTALVVLSPSFFWNTVLS